MTYFVGNEHTLPFQMFYMTNIYNAHYSSLLYLMLFCQYMDTPKASTWQQTVTPNASTTVIVSRHSRISF